MSRALAGAVAQGQGASFETWLRDFIFAPMLRNGVLVRADKLDPPARSVWDARRGRMVMVPVAAGGADFVLCLHDARYAAIEAKSTGESRLYRDHIEPHQVAHLDAAAAAGGGAYLAVQFRAGRSTGAYLVQWADVPWFAARTAPSITAADLEPWQITNWLDAARLLGCAS